MQVIVLNLVLKATRKPVTVEMFWRFLIGTIAMCGLRFAGETAASAHGLDSSSAWQTGC